MTPNEVETTAPATEQGTDEHTHAEGHTHDHDHEHHHHGPVLNPELTREISVEAPAEDVAKAYRKAIKQYQQYARIPGFRPGKVPQQLVRRKFASELRQEVMESLVSEKFREALEAQKLSPISQPQITELNLIDDQPLRFRASFEIAPVFEIDGYDTVTATKPDSTVTDEEFEGELDYLLNQHATIETVEEDRPLQDGDSAEINFNGKIKDLAQTVGEDGLESLSNDAPIEGEDVLVEIGAKNTLAAFNDALRGRKIGEEIVAEVDYPADFGDGRLSGKTVEYDIKVKGIKKKTMPERTDDLAKQIGSYETWDDLLTKVRENIVDRKTRALENAAKDAMLDQLVNKYEFPVPETFVQGQIDSRLDRGLRALAQQGMTAEQMRQLDFNRLREANRDEAVKEVKASMILDKIAEKEGVEIDNGEVDRELFMLSLQQREPIEELRERLTKDGTVDRIRSQMRREKAAAKLYEKLTA